MSASSVNASDISSHDFLQEQSPDTNPDRLDYLAEHAKVIALSHAVASLHGDGNSLIQRSRQNMKSLEVTLQDIRNSDESEASPNSMEGKRREQAMSLLKVIHDFRQHLPRQLDVELPKLDTGSLRVHSVAHEFLRLSDNQVNLEELLHFVAAYQTIAPLTIGETWSLPLVLRLVLVENLCQIAPRVFASIHANHLETTTEDFVATGRVISSLRRMNDLELTAFFEQASLVEDALRKDPAHVYSWMDVDSRNRYRQVVDDLARGTGMPDVEVARRAVEFAETSQIPGDIRRRHVGYYLIDEGRQKLEATIGYHPKIRQRVSRFVMTHATAVYLGSITTLTLLGLVLAWILATVAGGSAAVGAVAVLLMLLPASELAVSVVNYCVTIWLPPHTLPKLELKNGIPAACQTIVVIPAILHDERDVDPLLERLERHFLANQGPHLSFALLSDFSDAPAPNMPGDQAVLNRALEGIRKLNARYGASDTARAASARDRFFLLHRARRWNSVDKIWMGWERKRGKLIEFNRLLQGDPGTSYILNEDEAARLPKVKYVISLDADTSLPHGTAKQLVGTLAHPLNRPILIETPTGKRVESGYALLQPRVGVSLTKAYRSWHSWMFANGAGLSPYVTASSDVYQDLFHEGSFCGKGIYDVAAFQAQLDQTLPENHILSHDLIEGCHARVGLVTDVVLMDGFPTRYDADARRQHRWTRGDWQLLPWLGRRVPTAEGMRANTLSLISRWKIFDNMRRSLVPPALLILILAGWTFLPGPPVAWTLMALLVPAFPLIVDLAQVLRTRPPEASWHDQWRAVARHVTRTVVQTTCAVVFLPHRSQLMVDAICRALNRMYRTRQNMLEWESAAATERRLSGHPLSYLREMWFPPIFSLVMFAVAVAGGLKSDVIAIPLLLAWLVSPFVARAISRPIPRRQADLTPEQRQWLWQVARKTWNYFQTNTGPDSNWLVPDNVHDTAVPKVANQISPTNQGLFLVSALAAHDLGFLGLKELIELVEANLDVWEKLERYEGHPFNWYDTKTLQPKSPRYVSTVDNGNLAVCLLTMEQGLLELASRQSGPLRERLRQLSERCATMVHEMDFRILFDQQRRLFHIGLNADTQQLDAAHYDLLATEARLASYVAIAKGDVDHRHWFQLGRGMTRVADRPCLLSWGGSMFEYLMPALFTRTIPESLLDHACRAAVARQIEYGRQRRVPWGVSESSFYTITPESDFGYQAFGVPGLGLKQGLEQDLVVAPYASALALAVDSQAAARNLAELASDGALGRCGFYDAIDYTRCRLPRGQQKMVVPCYMAHHQGMTLIALVNCLLDDCMARRFHSHAAIRASELLLHERVPDGVAPVASSEVEDDETGGPSDLTEPDIDITGLQNLNSPVAADLLSPNA